MKYQIHECDDGRFEIQRVEPVTIGVMYDLGLANMVLAMMSSMAGEPDDQPEPGEIALPEALAPALPQTGKTGLPLIGGEFVPVNIEPAPAVVMTPAPAVVTALKPETAPPEKPETPLQEAFRRLEAGEKLGAVADDVGLPMPQLRGQWARRQRSNDPAPAPTPAPAVPTMSRGEVENCKLCEREFRPSDTSDGLCSRCRVM